MTPKFDFSRFTPEEAAREYKRLAKIHHPDLGGSLQDMQELNEVFSRYSAAYAKRSAYARQEENHAAGKKSAADFHNMDDLEREIYETINTILNQAGSEEIDLELIGLWLWATGNTRAIKDALKEAGFKWAPKKLAWYKPFVPSFSRGSVPLEKIRASYGSTKFSKDYTRQDDSKDEQRQTKRQEALI